MGRYTINYGGITRGPLDEKKLAVMFTGGFFAEGAPVILDALQDRKLPASFFVTGDFLRIEEYHPAIRRIVAEGHYLGPHSDTHPLYSLWEDRNTTIITRDEFTRDLEKNLADLSRFGPTREHMRFWIPPFEWYNDEIAGWSRDLGMILFNYTPGTRSNSDWAPDDNRSFVPSEQIYQSILEYEEREADGLNGFLLLMHLGAGADRTDKMHPLIPGLLDALLERGYTFLRVDELLKDAEHELSV